MKLSKNQLLWTLLMAVGVIQCKTVTHIAGEGAMNYRIEARTPDLAQDDPLHTLIAPYKERLRQEMDEEIGVVASQLVKEKVESTLGNWVADAVYEYAERITNRDFAFGLCNSGGIRIQSLGAGPVTKGKIFELMPFDNYVVVTKMSGVILQKLFDRMARSEGWPISHGVSYQIEGEKATHIQINGMPLQQSKEYEVVLSDYLSEGGGGLDFLESIPYENLNVYYRDALIEQVKWTTAKGEMVDAELEGRVTVIK